MEFKMVEKGWEYRTADDKVSIKKDYVRVRVTNTGFVTLDAYRTKAMWYVYGLRKGYVFSFKYLKEAKAFIEKQYSEEL